jgi:4-hydroxybenzoate polyprenyltransferase
LTSFRQYLAERFPLERHGPLIVVFSAAAVSHGARVMGQPVTPAAMVTASLVVLLQFLLMRCADDVKDLETDRRWRPQRPLPRGLLSLADLAALAGGAAALQWGLLLLLRPAALPLLAVVWGWFLLMSAEFFCPGWLRLRLGLYAVSHLLIVPLLALLAMAVALPPAAPPLRLLPFLVCTYGAALGLELARKTWRPGSEPPGVESYSARWGWRGAVGVWLLALALAVAGAIAAALVVPQASLPLLLTPPLLLILWRVRPWLMPAVALPDGRPHPLAGPTNLWIVVLYLALGWAP